MNNELSHDKLGYFLRSLPVGAQRAFASEERFSAIAAAHEVRKFMAADTNNTTTDLWGMVDALAVVAKTLPDYEVKLCLRRRDPGAALIHVDGVIPSAFLTVECERSRSMPEKAVFAVATSNTRNQKFADWNTDSFTRRTTQTRQLAKLLQGVVPVSDASMIAMYTATAVKVARERGSLKEVEAAQQRLARLLPTTSSASGAAGARTVVSALQTLIADPSMSLGAMSQAHVDALSSLCSDMGTAMRPAHAVRYAIVYARSPNSITVATSTNMGTSYVSDSDDRDAYTRVFKESPPSTFTIDTLPEAIRDRCATLSLCKGPDTTNVPVHQDMGVTYARGFTSAYDYVEGIGCRLSSRYHLYLLEMPNEH